MVIKNTRFGPVVRIGPAKSPGVSQLQTEEKSIIRTCGLAMLFNESPPQSRQALPRVRRNNKLIRIGPPFVRHRDRFPSPDEFRSALSEAPPTANGKLAGFSIRGAVPSFHRMNHNAVPDLDSITHEGRQKRRGSPLDGLGVTRNRESK